MDIGNTNTVLGVFSEKSLVHEWRIRTDRYKTEDELGMLVKSLFDYEHISFSDIENIIISSVVPPMMQAVEHMCVKYFKLTPFVVGNDNVRAYLDIRYPRPEEIGADRLVNAIGAISLYDAPLIIIDFGTATTFCYVDENRAYYGGIIAPGVKISMDALYAHAAKLPKIEIQKPETVVGASTVGAMQSGVYYGYIGQVDGIVQQMKQEVQKEPTVIATGGLASLIVEDSTTIQHIEKNLTLIGLQQIYQKNKG